MKCSISAGHSCSVIRVAIIQDEGAQKGLEELLGADCEPPHTWPATGRGH